MVILLALTVLSGAALGSQDAEYHLTGSHRPEHQKQQALKNSQAKIHEAMPARKKPWERDCRIKASPVLIYT